VPRGELIRTRIVDARGYDLVARPIRLGPFGASLMAGP
jgi:hypothetical protein